MKKIVMTLIMLSFALPSLASCSLTTGFCAPDSSVLSGSDISDKYVPNKLNELQKPNAFAPQYHQPFNDMLINTEQEEPQTANPNDQYSYDSNCQFGVCLPGSGMIGEP